MMMMMMMMMVMIETLGRDSGGHDVTAAKRVTCAERERACIRYEQEKQQAICTYVYKIHAEGF